MQKNIYLNYLQEIKPLMDYLAVKLLYTYIHIKMYIHISMLICTHI